MFVPRYTNDKSLVKIHQCILEIMQKQTPKNGTFLTYLVNFSNKVNNTVTLLVSIFVNNYLKQLYYVFIHLRNEELQDLIIRFNWYVTETKQLWIYFHIFTVSTATIFARCYTLQTRLTTWTKHSAAWTSARNMARAVHNVQNVIRSHWYVSCNRHKMPIAKFSTPISWHRWGDIRVFHCNACRCACKMWNFAAFTVGGRHSRSTAEVPDVIRR